MSDFDQLGKLVDRVERYQTQTRMSDKAFCGRYRDFVGSPKTWRDRLLARKFKDINQIKWVARLNELVAVMDGGSRLESFYDLPFVKKFEGRLALLEGQQNDRRCLVVLAPTGVGKSVTARNFADADRKTRTYVRALPTWRENEGQICEKMAEALTCSKPRAGAAHNLDAIIASMRATPLTMLIDEAHDGGIMLMKLIRTLIDATPSRFVYLAYPTDFDRVRNATIGGLVEAQQFLGRCMKPIFDTYREGVMIEDVVAYLKACHDGFNGDARAIADEILPILRRHFNFRLLDDAIAEAKFAADEEDTELDGRLIIKHVESLVGKVNTQKKEAKP